jgi:tellurite methyltransferase
MSNTPNISLPAGETALQDHFGDIDIYLFDQLLRGRISPGMRVLDAGCGRGRNLVYMLRAGFDVYGVDADQDAIDAVRQVAKRLAPGISSDHFNVERLPALSFPDRTFDAVIANAVLHFAADEAEFEAMLGELWRVLGPDGVLFARLASSIGLEDRIRPLGGRRHALPDGTDRFLVDEQFLLAAAADLEATLLDPIKTVNVQGQRCMTTWCIRKGS